MGLCRDFGSQIAEGCNHLMRADADSCHCDQCGVVCNGRFEACPSVWAQGPQPVVVLPSPPPELSPPLADRHTNGHGHDGHDGHGHDEHAVPPGRGAAAVAGNLGMGTPVGSAGTGVGTDHPVGAKDTAAEVVRGFQRAFDALRVEVESLRTALVREQHLVASLLESRSTEAEVDPETLRALVSTSVEEVVGRRSTDLRAELTATVAGLRHDLEAARLSHEEKVAGLRAALAEAAAAAAAERAGLKSSMEAVVAAAASENGGLESSVSALHEIQASFEAVAADNAGLPAELNRRDAAGRKAFRATLREELQPLVDVVADSVAQSDYELKALGRRVDSLMESEASMSAALNQVAASMAAMAGGAGADGDEPEPEPATRPARPARSALLDRVAAGAGTPASAGAGGWVAGTPRRPSPSRPAAAATRGNRVSTRRSPPAD
jgi:hypothetical protein